MKREYDFHALALRYGFNTKDMEKACRISDMLEDISAVKFLSERLVLYGGTALTFIHFKEILRLSIDMDLNYRHKDNADWGQVREEIDKRLKDVLYRQGYNKTDIAINASYPLTRFTVKYINVTGSEDSFKIEIGYMRRTPILKTDIMADFKHIGTQETFKITTPTKEELFANKWCTMLYRKTARDVFDIYRIADTKFNHNTFRKCAIIDSLTRKRPKLYEISPEAINKIPLDSSLKNLLQTEKPPKFDYNKISAKATEFTKTQLQKLTTKEKEMIDQFWEKKKYRPELIDTVGIFHMKIAEYPAALWILEKLKRKKKEDTGT
ncbi:MAG: nucleotidyl transferase AbiEii/AbiGii toxin family protein [Candidatus Bathyarchaeia archaeon]|jgi:predicted nucleotidyltransferase component of viral defense system|nr:nucleotidyl transferase AbiEii/AbiGii toxin family protein [Candidatus Bathyarchaeota archaeon A05DMB-4]